MCAAMRACTVVVMRVVYDDCGKSLGLALAGIEEDLDRQWR